MRKDGHVPNRSDHAAACPQVFKETPKPVKPIVKSSAAPKKSRKKNQDEEVVEEVAEEVVEAAAEEAAEVVEDEDAGSDDES